MMTSCCFKSVHSALLSVSSFKND